MSIFVFDGPEKAGKSTLIDAFVRRAYPTGKFILHRWGPVEPDDRVYAPVLRDDLVVKRHPSIWDRSWVSEHVYASLLSRDRRLRGDPWLGEWLHGRAVYTNGIGIIVTADTETLKHRRDSSDLPVDPSLEKRMFEGYANRFGWLVVNPTRDGVDESIRQITEDLSRTAFSLHSFDAPAFAGRPNSPVLVVGEARNIRSRFPGSWLPFTSVNTIRFARFFGDDALKWGWTNSNDVTDEMLVGKQVVVCVGKHAFRAVPSTFSGAVLHIPHPAHEFRWTDGVEYEKKLKSLHEKILTEI